MTLKRMVAINGGAAYRRRGLNIMQRYKKMRSNHNLDMVCHSTSIMTIKIDF